MYYYLLFVTSVYGASFYGESTRYPSTSSYYNQNQFPYKNNYGSDIAPFSAITKYPFNTGYSTSRFNSPGTGNVFLPSYTTPRYGSDYGKSYGQYGNMEKNYGPITSYERPFLGQYNNDYCQNRSPQNGIWIDSLTGMWYGVEFIHHLAGDARVDYGRTCIVIHISEPNDMPSTERQELHHVQAIRAQFRHEYRHLRLLWDEAGQTLEYALYFRNDSAGYWQTFDVQNGTLAARPSYHQFTGTVQVLKAVNDHLVLNFCQEAKANSPAQLYSVLFSREPGQMARWEVDAVHSMLQTKQLSVSSRRMVCGNGTARQMYGVMLSILSCLFAFVTM
ncbi:uncharacterized protein LOC125055905 [Pieris napi]|uniref:Uncharacterized protein n=1 Tax=Pieris macdunnoughi TaxID=345717 RepID=A0A821N2M8_9NEOP|nr:uncharacterized protein LOC125055905 [Pieris napi]CAF4780201.1 unnamed protein product [Pieris macdunnoughi]